MEIPLSEESSSDTSSDDDSDFVVEAVAPQLARHGPPDESVATEAAQPAAAAMPQLPTAAVAASDAAPVQTVMLSVHQPPAAAVLVGYSKAAAESARIDAFVVCGQLQQL